MRVLIQRVTEATVKIVPLKNSKNIEEKNKGLRKKGIKKGLLLLVGIGKEDRKKTAEEMARKIYYLRIFEKNGKFDLSLKDIDGEVLAVPQFTLYGNTDRGRRPDFTKAESPQRAEELFNYFCEKLSEFVTCKKGFFGEKMQVELVNDGPVTLMVEK